MTTNAATSPLPRTAFRIVAFAEALSWLGLLIGMFFKWVLDAGEAGVKIFGPIHGTIFIAYVVVSLWVSRAHRWDAKTVVLALVSSLPPFCTVVFERWAERTGRLTVALEPAAQRQPA